MKARILQVLRQLLSDFPWPLLHFLALSKRYDHLKPWKLIRARRAIRSCNAARQRPRHNRQVVFVSDAPRMREAKIARGLRAAGWEVILLYRHPTAIDIDYYFGRSQRYRDVWDALQQASSFSPAAFHVFIALTYDTALKFVRHRPGPVVVDSCDILRGMKSPWYIQKYHPGQLALERECLEQADGICSRDLQVQYARKTFRYRRGGPTIFFPDLSLADAVLSAPLPSPDGGIHVVLIGIIGIERFHPYWPDTHFLKVAQALCQAEIHLHMYASAPLWRNDFESTFHEYLSLAQNSRYFHLHRPVPLLQLLEEMRRYTFGIHVAGSMIHHRETPHGAHRRACYDYAVTNRNFDYLQAGLPVILHDGKLPQWVVSRLGVAICPDEEFLKSPAQWLRERLPTEPQRRKLLETPAKVSMMRQIPRLERFYRSLANAR